MKFKTHSGAWVSLLNPSPDSIKIEDIAISLSQQCRYLGHTREFYSVGQHSLLLAYLGAEILGWGIERRFLALMHDAAEAYLGDHNSLVKGNTYYKINNSFWLQADHEALVLSTIIRALSPLPFTISDLDFVWDMHKALTRFELYHFMGHEEKDDDQLSLIRMTLDTWDNEDPLQYSMEKTARLFHECYKSLFWQLETKTTVNKKESV